MLTIESSGITVMRAAAEAAEAAAPAKSVVGGVFSSGAASGRSLGEKSIAVPISGKISSLEASNMPMRSSSSASLSNGIADETVKPAFSSLVSSPSCAVCKEE